MSTIPEKIQTPTYPQFTNLALNEGLSDQLMTFVDHHLDKQFTQNRLKGSDYAQTYIASIQGVLQYTTQYLLGIMLIDEQKDKLLADIALVETQEKQLELQSDLIELDKLKLKYQIEELLPLEKDKLELEVERVRQEGLLIAAQISKTTAEIAHMVQQEELWDKEEAKITAEIAFLAAQEAMMVKQALKIDKEIEFLSAKILTELANTTTVSSGLVGAQMSLLEAQKLGFAGDLKIKAAKVIADYDAVVCGVLELPGNVILSDTASGAYTYATDASAISAAIEAA